MIKKCEYCGKEFEAKSWMSKFCYEPHYANCPICGKQYEIKDLKRGGTKTCSKECAAKLRVKTQIEKYGPGGTINCMKRRMKEKYGTEYAFQVPELREKFENTMEEKYGTKSALESKEIINKMKEKTINKYGVENVMQVKEFKENQIESMKQNYNITDKSITHPMQILEIKEKVENTCLEKYGSKSPLGNKEIHKKIKETVIERYGVDNNLKIPEIIENRKRTWIKNYGVSHPLKSKEIQKKISNRYFNKTGYTHSLKDPKVRKKIEQTNLRKYGVPYNCMRKEVRFRATNSKINQKFQNLLTENNIEWEMEFPIKNKSYDIKIKNQNILIEINPTRTHNSYKVYATIEKNGLSTNYHLEKSQLAQENGYFCIHVWDWNDWYKIIDLVNPDKEKIYARKCKIKKVSKEDCKSFEIINHLQGYCNKQDIRLGLYYNDELVQLMTFGKPRYNKNYQYELLRLCSKSGYSIIGGAEKLFKHFIKNYSPESIISYCDKSKFTGEVYRKLDMKLIKETGPTIIWSKKNEIITSNLLNQYGFDKLFNTNYGKGTSNKELMIQHGWLPVYDCGQMVFEWKNV